MKPETKRREGDGGGGGGGGSSSPFNLSSLKHAIDAVDISKEKSIDLSSLSVSLLAASREMKLDRRRENRKKKLKKKKMKMKQVIGKKPETQEELRRWYSNLDESLKPNKLLQVSLSKHKTFKEPQICQLNTDYTMNLSPDSFRFL